MFKGTINTKTDISSLNSKLVKAIDLIQNGRFDAAEAGKYQLEQSLELLVQEYQTDPASTIRMEKHEHSVELIYIADGEEAFQWCKAEELTVPVTKYELEKDRTFFETPEKYSEVVLGPGEYVVVYPEDGHKTRCNPPAGSNNVRKYLVKLWI